jgi:hypothetical protein
MLFFLPLGAQAACLFIDEFVFHYRRGLGKWERRGHPIDTLSVLLCFCVPAFFDPTQGALAAFGSLSVFSSLLVTKDEWVHAAECEPLEHWLHAVLFVLHPVVLISVGWVWWNGYHEFARSLVLGQVGALAAFTLYQFFFWRAWE